MKNFKEFIVEAEITEILSIFAEAKSPNYSDEHAQIRLYNHLVGSSDRRRRLGRQVRSAIASGDMDRVREIAMSEISASKSDPNHPLHFNNAPDDGFSGKKKTDDHRDAYYARKQSALPGFMSFVGSRAGKSMSRQGYRGEVKGSEHLEAKPDWTGNKGGQGRADLEFKSKDNPKAVHRASQKDYRGSQAMSAGGDQTAATLTAAGKEVARKMMPWTRRRRNPDESPEDYKLAMTREKLAAREKGRAAVSDVQSRASDIGSALDSTKGKKVADQKPTVSDVSSRIDDLEKDYPGIKRAAGQEALTGRAQYGERGRVHSMYTTGGDSSSFVNPRQQEVSLRPRAGKGNTRPAVVAGDIAAADKTKKKRAERQATFRDFSRRNAP